MHFVAQSVSMSHCRIVLWNQNSKIAGVPSGHMTTLGAYGCSKLKISLSFPYELLLLVHQKVSCWVSALSVSQYSSVDFFFKDVLNDWARIQEEGMNDGKFTQFLFPSLSTSLNPQLQPWFPPEMYVLMFSAKIQSSVCLVNLIHIILELPLFPRFQGIKFLTFNIVWKTVTKFSLLCLSSAGSLILFVQLNLGTFWRNSQAWRLQTNMKVFNPLS